MKLMSYEVIFIENYEKWKEVWNSFDDNRPPLEEVFEKVTSRRKSDGYIRRDQGRCIKTGTKAQLRHHLKQMMFFDDPLDSIKHKVWKKDWREVVVGIERNEVNYAPKFCFFRAE